MKKVILLCGKSGSGKDFFVEAFNLKPVVSRTTREKRQGEVEGVSKKFKTLEEYKNESPKVAETFYNDNYYWTMKEDFNDADVYIIDRDGVVCMKDTFKSEYKDKFKCVYLECGLLTRVRNMRKRGETFKFIYGRLLNDKKMFRGIEKLADTIINI